MAEALPTFFECLLQHPNLEDLICPHLLELRILLLKLLEALEIGHFHPAILAPPPIKGLFADVRLPADLFHGFLSVGLAQYLYYLFGRVSLFLHVGYGVPAPKPNILIGPVFGGHITHENIEDGIDDLSAIGGRSSSFFRFREHGFN